MLISSPPSAKGREYTPLISGCYDTYASAQTPTSHDTVTVTEIRAGSPGIEALSLLPSASNETASTRIHIEHGNDDTTSDASSVEVNPGSDHVTHDLPFQLVRDIFLCFLFMMAFMATLSLLMGGSLMQLPRPSPPSPPPFRLIPTS